MAELLKGAVFIGQIAGVQNESRALPGHSPHQTQLRGRAVAAIAEHEKLELRIPRNDDDDYSDAAIHQRQAFVESFTGVKLQHINKYSFDPHIVEVISKSDLIPVIAPIGVSRDGQTLNINADTFASALAAKMKAKRLLLLTDVAGVLDKDQNLLPQLTVSQARELIRDGTISGGMIPKIEGCIDVVEAGVEAVVIIDGRVPHCVLLELFTEHGVGTMVKAG